MQESQTNELRAALERAAATMRQATANQYVAQNFGAMQPPGPTSNQYVAANFPPVMAQGGAPAARAPSVPIPQARPAAAPQAVALPNDGGMGFFTRNAMLMQDPATGQYIDPAGAAKAQASMPQQDQGSLIQWMLGRLGNKANA